MEIGKYLQKARKRKGLSQEEAANFLNVSRQSVSLWENDQTQPTLDNLDAMSDLYGVTISVLTGQMQFPEEIQARIQVEESKDDVMPEIAEELPAKRAHVPTIISFGIGMALIVFFAVPYLGIGLSLVGIISSVSARKLSKNKFNLAGLIFSSVYLIAALVATIAGSNIGLY